MSVDCPDFGSVCSGIEAASVAWHPLGWRAAWLAEIDDSPSAILAHHYPDVPNLGDMTKIAAAVRAGIVDAPDVMVGGTPCQAFSVAGLRGGLTDERGALTLAYVKLADEIDTARSVRGRKPAVIVWENVPGVLSDKTNAFGCFLGGLAGSGCELQPTGKRWGNAGCVYGPSRAVAWRVLDAQYFGLAQRRRRVFVVASARDGFDPAAVLFEFDGVRRDSAPSREPQQSVAAGTLRSTDGGSDVDHARAGHLQPVTCMAHGQGGAEVAEDCSPTLTCNHEAPIAFMPDIAHTLRAEGFDASEDGTGRGTPLVPVRGVIPYDLFQVTAPINRQNRDETSPCHTLARDNAAHAAHAAIVQPVAFSCKDHGADASDVSPTLRAMGHAGSHANAGWQVAVAFHGSQDPDVSGDVTHPVGRNQGQETCAQVGMQVRRLTPRECERLQGFPDDYTRIPERFYKAKPNGKHFEKYPDLYDRLPDGRWVRYLADGPRYKALGNSMAERCMRWIGIRIAGALAAPPPANDNQPPPASADSAGDRVQPEYLEIPAFLRRGD